MQPKLSTTGGTSDARFIKNICPVTEFGLVGKTMHAIERVEINQLTNWKKSILNSRHILRKLKPA